MYLNGEYIETPPGMKRHTFINKLSEWRRMYEMFGKRAFDHYHIKLSIPEKIELVKRVTNGESMTLLSMEFLHTRKTEKLSRWYHIYLQKGISGLESYLKEVENMNKKRKTCL